MTGAPGDGRGRGDDWLGWEPEPVEPADAPTSQQDHAIETTGPWLRHEPQDLEAFSPREPSPWLAPDTVADAPARHDVVEDTGVPPTLAEDPAIPETTPTMATAPTAVLPTVAPPTDDARTAGHVAGDAAGDAARSDTDAQDTDRHRKRKGSGKDDADEPTSGLAVLGAAVKEFAIVVGMALVLSFIVKTWLLQAFYIPSGSMENTLLVNDRVIVSKLTPGPLELKRGDIVVFADPGDWVDPPVAEKHGKVATIVRDAMMFVGLLPDDSENHLIKRVIGLPGDHVACCDQGGRLTVNGQPVVEPYLKPGVAPSDQDFDVVVPRGRVWVMGDNRSGSADSRAHLGPENDVRLGSVDERLIVGRAVALVWPLDHLTWLGNPSQTFKDVPAPKPTDAEESPPTDGEPGTDAPTTGGGDVGTEGGG